MQDDFSRKVAKAQSTVENIVSREVVDAAVSIHKELGPGLMEKVYETVLERELSRRGLKVERQVKIPIQYGDLSFEEGFQADLIVERKVVLELKSVEKMQPLHHKQLNTYLRLTGLRLGILLNFGSCLMKNGVVRVVNNLEDSPFAPSRLCVRKKPHA